ncbi:hypothetical protein ACIA5G_53450 [Amycolatopsis sp. NPDC051758]|uniref:hypothetical protein n=1 Tax=Amycolatopsis sp. NPDC051758 TaxID=3363935 RepID=UPI003788157D
MTSPDVQRPLPAGAADVGSAGAGALVAGVLDATVTVEEPVAEEGVVIAPFAAGVVSPPQAVSRSVPAEAAANAQEQEFGLGIISLTSLVGVGFHRRRSSGAAGGLRSMACGAR